MSQVSEKEAELSNDRCPTGYRIIPLVPIMVRLLRICVCAHAYLNYQQHESIFYIRRGLRVVSSILLGNATASIRGTGKCKFHAFIIPSYKINKTHHRYIINIKPEVPMWI